MTNLRPAAPGEILLPREVVLASAGTGKTFTLSTRLIRLLSLGAPPDTLLASTFTRKAAGEILARVLARLARASLDEEQARNLGEEIGGANSAPQGNPPSRETFSILLRSLVRELHRANIGTLDSLFVKIAGSFQTELGMPPGWTISDEPTAQRMESDALQEVLSGAGPGGMVELVRMTMRGESGRGVHHRLLLQLKELRALLHQQGALDPEAVWLPPEPGSYPPTGAEEEPDSWEKVLREMKEAPLPETAKGKPDSRFQKAVEDALEALRKGDWEGFCGKGLGSKVMEEADVFHRKAISPEIRRVFQEALRRVAGAVHGEIVAQTSALRALVLAFDGALDEIHRREGAYRFEDITFLLAGRNPVATRSDLWYRLDQKAHHLLLDEFQDTSRAQWEALAPLTSELLSGHAEERSALVVADPKQSIYGWRGAEPSLARRVGDRFGMEERSLEESYRSSGHILDLVNAVFSDLPDNPVWDLAPDLLGAVREWAVDFPVHLPALDLPGHVSMEVGPPEEQANSSDRRGLMAWSASRIRDLHRENPEATVGVLVRRNATGARLMANLRNLGVHASEEGATALTDSPAVSTFLALLRLADHPGNPVARFQVAQSPLGHLVGLTEPGDAPQARQLALAVRRKLLTHGYGSVISGWVEDLRNGDSLSHRDLGRLLQLVELAFRWDGRSTVRPQDFVRFVQTEAVEAPSDAKVRVMTVHKAKGLEFDVVVLPELDDRLTRGQGLYRAVLPLRDPGTGRVRRIFPSLSQSLRPLFPEMEEAARQDRERELQDALGVAYVALTRARHALHLFTSADRPDREPKLSFTFAGLLRGGLGLEERPREEGEVLFEAGASDWAAGIPRLQEGAKTSMRPGREAPPPAKPPSRSGPRRRLLPHRSPSALKDFGRESLPRVLSLSDGRGRRVGTLVHAWLEELGWIEDWNPDPDLLFATGSRLLSDLSREESLGIQRNLEEWLAFEEVRARLSSDAYPPGSEVRTEESFALRLDDTLFQGRIDRLVLVRERGRPVGAEVLDFKTDRLPPGDEGSLMRAAQEYEGQMAVYRAAVSSLFKLPPEAVSGSLVFLAQGRVQASPP